MCNTNLLFYVRYMIDPNINSPIPLHENICKHWLEMLTEKESEGYNNLEYGEVWILLNVILKSMIVKISSTPFTPDSRLKSFPPDFTHNLKELCLILFCAKREIQNMEILTLVPLFIK